MLRRNGIKTARLICSRCRYRESAFLAARLWPSIQTHRQFHSSQSNRGLLEGIVKYLSGDRNHEKLHKEIGKMLEEYDETLLKCYNKAYDSYNKAYYTGARKDLLTAFDDLATLQTYILRMEVFVKNNDFLKNTKVAEVIGKSEYQQKANDFLEAMDVKYGDDVQYQNIVGPSKVQQKYEPMDLAGPFHGGRVSGFFARVYTWVRKAEMEQFQKLLNEASEMYDRARKTGRRKDLKNALYIAQKLDLYMQRRHGGKFSDEEQAAERMDVRYQKTEEEIQKLNKLKGDANAFIKQVIREFDEASKR